MRRRPACNAGRLAQRRRRPWPRSGLGVSVGWLRWRSPWLCASVATVLRRESWSQKVDTRRLSRVGADHRGARHW